MQEKEQIKRTGLEIAIIGMSGRFPGARNVHEFWENLKNGVNSIRFFTREEILEKAHVPLDELNNPNYIGSKGVIDDMEYFDAFFFGYSPLEAEILDPQVRCFYEICWEALEDAACDPATFKGGIGVYAGATSNRWWEVLAIFSGKTETVGNFASDYLIDKDFLSTRISYKLDLKGPAITLHTACSTALVSVELACRGLLTGQCDAALAGGVSLVPRTAGAGGYIYEEGMIRSEDGYVRAFDAKAKGVVFSDGAGVVLLKRLDDAIADRDNIYAVIKGFAANNDGVGKSSFSAPGVDGQAEVIRTALFMAEVEPESITYVETHGTGTEIGDPIEIEALKIAFNTGRRHFCAVGSVKTNIGHLDTAAGIASLIKTVLALKYRQIPPSLNFETPNPKIDFENSPFYVNTRLQEWKSNGYPLRAGVSSFGVGGTNAHVVIEEPPEQEPSAGSRPYQLILFSTRTANALEQMTRQIAGYLKENPGDNLADVAYSLKPGRKTFEHKRMLVCTHVEEAVDILELLGHADHGAAGDSQRVQTFYGKEERRVVFMFPGQGSQYVNMARGIYETEAVFREEMDRCFDLLNSLMGCNLKELLYPSGEAAKNAKGREGLNIYPSIDIDQTEIAQPVIFTLEYALAKLLISWGVAPYAMIGHSIGEYAAACLSGVFSLEDALTLVVQRGKLMQQMPFGGMLSVSLGEHQLQSLLTKGLDLAVVNGPSQCVVSGPHEAVDAFTRQLENSGHQYRKLHTSHAYHSRMMEPILKPFEEKAARVKYSTPTIPFISNVSGQWITFEDAADPGYWSGHLRRTVRFGDGLAELLKEKNSILIEVGPGRTLSTFVRRHPDKQPGHMLVNLVRHPGEEAADEYYLLTRLGQVWLYGKEVDWREFYSGERRYRLHLPTYPFQRQYYWIEGDPYKIVGELPRGRALQKKNDISDWFYVPSWKRSIFAVSLPEEDVTGESRQWLLFVDDGDFAAQLRERLVRDEKENAVTVVKTGAGFSRQEQGVYTIDHCRRDDYDSLLDELQASGRFPNRVVYLWNLQAVDRRVMDIEAAEKHLELGFYSLLYLAQALGSREYEEEIHITILTNGAHEVWEEKVLFPEKAAVLGPVQIIPREYSNLKCRCIDIVLPTPGTGVTMKEEQLIDRLIRDFKGVIIDSETVVAFRGNQRLVRTFEPVLLGRAGRTAASIRLREGGVYLVTGGLGGIGLVLAHHLARTVQAKLILTARTALPDREDWDRWLSTHDNDSRDRIGWKIRKVREIESLGAEVLVFGVDVTDREGMEEVIKEVGERFGTIHGVIHAAGVAGGGVVQLKTREIAAAVLTPKIKGTLVLNRVLESIEPDFFILCSSINSVLPLFGQVDYCAANAFLDAFAFYKNAFAGNRTFFCSIDWDAWQETGMAVEAAKLLAGNISGEPRSAGKEIDHPHPLLDHYRLSSRTYTSYFSLSKNWVLSEHMTGEGMGLLPGVTFLEMVYTAFKTLAENQEGIVEIRDVSFLNPLITSEGEEREVRTVLKPGGEGFEFLISSRINPGDNGEGGGGWQDHAGGVVVRYEGEGTEPRRVNIKEIEARCNGREIDAAVRREERARGSLVVFGPRWDNIKTVRLGKNEALAFIELPGAFRSDLEEYTLYPAMLDNAAAFLYGYLYDESAYIPYSYGKLRIRGAFPARIYAYSRLAKGVNNDSGKDLLEFNITIMDEEGRELVDIEEFTMLEISEEIKEILREKGSSAAGGHAALFKVGDWEDAIETEEKEVSRLRLKDGILSAEGVEVLTRVLAAGEYLPQVVVSTRDLQARFEKAFHPAAESLAENIQDARFRGPTHTRPDISAAYTAPFTEAEQKMAGIWQELLGIDRVGTLDDFFELGGDSLKASAMISWIKKEFNAHISISDIFSAPRVRDLSRILEKPDRRDTVDTDAAVEAAEEKEYYMLSPMQKRMYILNELEGVGTAYNIPFIYLLEGKPDRQRLQRVLYLSVNRHENLRTSYRMMGPEPVQIVHDNADLPLEYWEAGENEIQSIISTFIRPFDLMCVPLMRAGLVKISPEKYVLFFDIHHIAADGSSIYILIKEFAALYAGKELPESGFRYKDFSEWQNRETGKAYLEKQKEFWLNRFKTDQNMAVPDIYTDFPRSGVQSFAGETISFLFDNTFTEKVNGLVKETGTTLYMVLLAALTIVLSKFSGHEDIVVGTSVAGRERPEFQDIVGLFINALPMRNYAGADKTFSGFLKEVKENTLEAFENQGYPFGELIKELGLLRDIGRHPLYDAELIVQNMEMPEFELEGLRFSRYEYDLKTTPMDIVLEAIEGEAGISFDLSYCTKLFKRETMEKFSEFFKQVLTTVIENREVKLGDMNVPHELGKAAVDVVQVEDIQFGF